MRKATKRVFIFLAVLSMLFACTVGASAAAKSPMGATITITKQPTDNTFALGWGEPNLSGLELKVKIGSLEKTIVYDDLSDGWFSDVIFDDDDTDFDIEWTEVWAIWPDEDVRLGNNKFYLDVSISADGEYYSNNKTPITFKAVPFFEKYSKDDASTLKAGVNEVTPGVADYNGSEAYGAAEVNLYAFTPKASGYYTFRSFSAPGGIKGLGNIFDFPKTLAFYLMDYFEDPGWYSSIFEAVYEAVYGAVYEFFYVWDAQDPLVTLLDSNGDYITENDDASDNTYSLLGKRISLNPYDFALVAPLNAGETYYLVPEAFSGDDTPYRVTVAYSAPA
ncbi:MAG: hypothetical protein LBB50_00870 [Oscillospiraceae bacterium]|jgi:hypothetical protein|nr:hypothetical protein [Oscillospiraceae bacterium]